MEITNFEWGVFFIVISIIQVIFRKKILKMWVVGYGIQKHETKKLNMIKYNHVLVLIVGLIMGIILIFM